MYPFGDCRRLLSVWLASLLAVVAILTLAGGTTKAHTNAIVSSNSVLQSSATVMQQLKSVHFTISDSSTMTTTAITPASTPPVAKGLTTSNGDELLSSPPAFHVSTTVNLANPSASSNKTGTVSVIVKEGQTYVQNSKGVWYQLSGVATKYVHLSVPPYTSTMTTLLPYLQNSTLTDHGIEKLINQNVHHISFTLGNTALNAFIKLEQSNSPTMQGNGTIDLWIDPVTSYIRHMVLISNTSFTSPNPVKPAGAPSSTPGIHPTIKAIRNLTVDFSQFNQIASIPTPPNPTLTSNPSVLLPPGA